MTTLKQPQEHFKNLPYDSWELYFGVKLPRFITWTAGEQSDLIISGIGKKNYEQIIYRPIATFSVN